VLGNKPGSKFDADLDPVQEARLIGSGAIRVAGGGVDTAPSETDEKPEDETVKDASTEKGSTQPHKQLP
jgi:hypothetical protein